AASCVILMASASTMARGCALTLVLLTATVLRQTSPFVELLAEDCYNVDDLAATDVLLLYGFEMVRLGVVALMFGSVAGETGKRRFQFGLYLLVSVVFLVLLLCMFAEIRFGRLAVRPDTDAFLSFLTGFIFPMATWFGLLLLELFMVNSLWTTFRSGNEKTSEVVSCSPDDGIRAGSGLLVLAQVLLTLGFLCFAAMFYTQMPVLNGISNRLLGLLATGGVAWIGWTVGLLGAGLLAVAPLPSRSRGLAVALLASSLLTLFQLDAIYRLIAEGSSFTLDRMLVGHLILVSIFEMARLSLLASLFATLVPRSVCQTTGWCLRLIALNSAPLLTVGVFAGLYLGPVQLTVSSRTHPVDFAQTFAVPALVWFCMNLFALRYCWQAARKLRSIR
ncbi:MAG: hypothetical protein AB7K24_18040, partial [Gemmataceae bacterium]